MSYKSSILCNNEYPKCYFCGSTNTLQRHHCIFGVANRVKADNYGLWVYLCWEHHEGKTGVHRNHDKAEELQILAQRKFEEVYGHEKWMQVFGRNYDLEGK